MKFPKVLLMVSLALLVLSGCGSKGGAEGEGEDEAIAAGSGTPAAGAPGGPRITPYGQRTPGGRYGTEGYEGGRSGAAGSGNLDDAAGPLAQRVILFAYDSYEVEPRYQAIVSAHARYLAAHPEQNAVLEGHADERGSPEYNIALGEQRARAISRMMALQGANAGQIQVVSFGEEKPAESGHDEWSWQQNRRVEISYPGH